MGRREERAYSAYVSDEQRRQPGRPARELGESSRFQGTSSPLKVRSSSSPAACGRRSSIAAMTDWFARPVLHVASVEASLRFYVERLGFTVAWQFDQDGRVFVAQVDRGSCALLSMFHRTLEASRPGPPWLGLSSQREVYSSTGWRLVQCGRVLALAGVMLLLVRMFVLGES